MFGSHRMKKMRFFIEHGRGRWCFMKSFVDHDCPSVVLRRRNEYREAKILWETASSFKPPILRGFFWLRHSPIQGEATRDVVTACHCAQTYSTPEHEVIQLLSAWRTARRHRERGSSRRSGIRFRCSGETVTPEDLGLFYKSDIWVRVAIFFSWLWRVINVVSSFSLHNNHFLQLWVETSDRNMLVWGHLLRLSLSKEGGCVPVGTWSTQGHASEVSPQINLWPVRSHSCFCTIHIRDDPWNHLHSGDLIRRLKQPSVYGSDEKHYEASPKQRKQKSR